MKRKLKILYSRTKEEREMIWDKIGIQKSWYSYPDLVCGFAMINGWKEISGVDILIFHDNLCSARENGLDDSWAWIVLHEIQHIAGAIGIEPREHSEILEGFNKEEVIAKYNKIATENYNDKFTYKPNFVPKHEFYSYARLEDFDYEILTIEEWNK